MMHSTASAQNLVRAKPCADSSTPKSMPFCVQNVVVWAIAVWINSRVSLQCAITVFADHPFLGSIPICLG
ncbi:MAG: hypothetical protein V7K18_11280 [Nostoc sp.]|uniref:hypothetical protein n=1 Tax=Nostoc sp. TaxID=1180 RepID=UPI002FF5F335